MNYTGFLRVIDATTGKQILSTVNTINGGWMLQCSSESELVVGNESKLLTLYYDNIIVFDFSNDQIQVLFQPELNDNAKEVSFGVDARSIVILERGLEDLESSKRM
jgi:hypothetical protein